METANWGHDCIAQVMPGLLHEVPARDSCCLSFQMEFQHWTEMVGVAVQPSQSCVFPLV